MDFSTTASDDQILQAIGGRVHRHRLDRNLTQAELASAAGVSKRTIERLEAGESTQLSNFIRILRALDVLEGLDALLPEPALSPLDQLKLRGRLRQRASSSREPGAPARAWSWAEDK